MTELTRPSSRDWLLLPAALALALLWRAVFPLYQLVELAFDNLGLDVFRLLVVCKLSFRNFALLCNKLCGNLVARDANRRSSGYVHAQVLNESLKVRILCNKVGLASNFD